MGCGTSSEPVEKPEQQFKQPHQASQKYIPEGKNDNADKYKLLKRGNQLISQKKFDQAQNILDRVLTIDPDFADAYYSKGIIAAENNNIDQALELFNAVLDRQPDHIYAMNEKASILIQKKNFNEALNLLQRATKIKGNLSEINYGLGYVLSRMDRQQEAQDYYDLAILQDPKQKHYYINKGASLLKLLQYEKAVECIQQSLKYDPNYLDAHVAICNVYAITGDQNKLVEACNSIIQLDPNNKFALIHKKEAERKLLAQPQQKQEKIQSQTKILSVDELLDKGSKLENEAKVMEALVVYKEVLKLEQQNILVLRRMRKIYLTSKRFAEALDILEKELSLNPKDLDALNDKVFILQELNKFQDVLICYDKILEIDHQFIILEKKANILVKLGKVEQASEIFENQLKQFSSNDPQVFLIRGKLLISQSQVKAAITCLQEGAQNFPSNLEILLLLSDQYLKEKQFDQALETFDKILLLDNSNEDCLLQKGSGHSYLGILLQRKQSYREALAEFQKIKGQSFDQLQFYIGFCQFELNQYPESLKCLNEYLQKSQQDSEKAYFIIGEIYLYQLKIDEAIESYQNCIKLNPSNAEAQFKLGEAYKQDKDIEKAKEYFQLAIKLAPTNNKYQEALVNLSNDDVALKEYRNSLLFTLIPFIGLCQLQYKDQNLKQLQSEKYLALLQLMETLLKLRFNSLENHFESIRNLIAKSYDMRLTVIDDTLYPIMQFWYNQKICKKKKDNLDFIYSMISMAKVAIDGNTERILSLISGKNQMKNKQSQQFSEQSLHQMYQKRSGQLGLEDGIKILGFILKYHKEISQGTILFQELISNKLQNNEIDTFHDSYYQANKQ